MNALHRMLLLALGLGALLAIFAAGASAQTYMDVTDVESPDWVYDVENVTVSYSLVSTEYTWDQIESTGLIWGERYLGEFVNHTRFNHTEVEANEAMEHTVGFPAPPGPDDVPVHVFVKVAGVHGDYNHYVGNVEVKVTPEVQFGGCLGWNLAGRDHEITAHVRDADPAEIEEVSVYWDTVPHGSGPVDKADYPNRSAVVTHQLLDPYHFNITLPDGPTVVHIMVHALINGRDFYDGRERGISVIAEPEFNVTAPGPALVGRDVDINWSIPSTAGAYIVNTSVYWDTESHAGTVDKAAYAHRSEELPGSDTRSYGTSLTIPEGAGAVYYVVHCVIELYGLDYYTDEELTIDVRDEPAVAVVDPPVAAFVGADVTFAWTVSAEAEDTESTQVHWDTTSHAGDMEATAYPHASAWFAGEADGTYEVTLEVPSEPGVVYYIAHAIVLGEHFYVDDELQVEVRALPEVMNVEGPDEVEEGGGATITFGLEGAEDPDRVEVLWDTEPHANATEYPSSVEAVDRGNGTWEATFDVPGERGTVHYRVHVREGGQDVYSPESTLEVTEGVEDSPGPGLLLAVAALALIAAMAATTRMGG